MTPLLKATPSLTPDERRKPGFESPDYPIPFRLGECMRCPTWYTRCVHFDGWVLAVVSRYDVPEHPSDVPFTPLEAPWQVARYREEAAIHCEFCHSRELDWNALCDSEEEAMLVFNAEEAGLRLGAQS